MKRIMVFLALSLLVFSAVSAQLPPQGFIGLWADEDHSYHCVNGTGMHTFYCFALPPETGLKCIELKTVLSSNNVMVFSPIFNENSIEPILGGVPGDLAMCFNSCQTDWVMAFSAQLFVLDTSLETIILEPFTGSPYLKILNCEGVEVEALAYSDLYINDPNCWIPPQPPYLSYVTVQDETHVVATFTEGVSDEQSEKYILFPKDNPADTIPVSDDELVNFNEVLLTLEEPLIQGVIYTLVAEDICNVIICATSQVDFMFAPVAALLQGFTAGYGQDGVELSWRLADAGGDILFSVSRRIAVGGALEDLESLQIERDGDTYTCTDTDVEPGESYIYRVDYVLGDEMVVLFETEVVQTPSAPLTLHQNVPNPFNPATEISYYLPATSDILLEVYDVTGKRVATLVRCREEKGLHVVNWQGVDGSGRAVASGIYFYRLRAGKEVISKKMVLLR